MLLLLLRNWIVIFFFVKGKPDIRLMYDFECVHFGSCARNLCHFILFHLFVLDYHFGYVFFSIHELLSQSVLKSWVVICIWIDGLFLFYLELQEMRCHSNVFFLLLWFSLCMNLNVFVCWLLYIWSSVHLSQMTSTYTLTQLSLTFIWALSRPLWLVNIYRS